jgi:hypothetical protein
LVCWLRLLKVPWQPPNFCPHLGHPKEPYIFWAEKGTEAWLEMLPQAPMLPQAAESEP